MFGLSLSELFIIFLFLIIFIKPSDLPIFYKAVLKFHNKLKNLLASTNAEYQKFKDEIKNEYGEDFFEDIDDINAEVSEIIGDDNKKYKAYDYKKIEAELKDVSEQDEK